MKNRPGARNQKYGQSIIRVEHSKDKPYILISRKMIEDTTISLEAKGLLLFLLAKPDDWKVRVGIIARELGLNPATVYRVLNKLIAGGYVHREILKRRDEDTGRFQTASIYIVFEDREHRREWIDRGRFCYEQNR